MATSLSKVKVGILKYRDAMVIIRHLEIAKESSGLSPSDTALLILLKNKLNVAAHASAIEAIALLHRIRVMAS